MGDAGEGGGEDGLPGCDGVGSADPLPDEPPSPVDPPCPVPEVGTGPDGATVREGVSGAGASDVASADGSVSPAPSPVPRAPWLPIRRGPPPRPSAVTPPGPGSAFFSSPCRAVLPDGLGCPGSLTLMHPASDAASAETVTAAAVTRASARPPDADSGPDEGRDEDRDADETGDGAAAGDGTGAGDDGIGDDWPV
ncbi:hypothetical protein AB0I10_16215 [Streptomyces sp. NPDC050636]|uniref:hypothetical protein n=1 Tax=Streptomyces sp. NPDC050636 TaxID=3154510 RepID=UPI00343C7F46